MTLNALDSNIWKYGVFLVTIKRLFVAILGAYYLSIPNTTAQDIGLILFFSTIAGFLLEIPSGYLSDKIGHKQALVLARILMLVSTILFLMADEFTLLLLGSVFLSIAFAFFSGTGSAFMHETLRALGKEEQYSEIMGKLRSLGFALAIPLMVLTPFLVSISFKAPFVVALVIDIIGLAVALSFIKPPVTAEEVEEVSNTNFKQVLKEGHKKNFFQFILFSGILAGMLWGISAFRPVYQSALEVPVIYFGIFLGIARAFASIIIAYSGKLKSYFNIYSFCRFKLVLYTVLIFILGFAQSTTAVVTTFIVMNAFWHGLSQINTGFALDIIKNSKFKATLLSVESQIDSLAAAAVSFAIGFMVVRSSYQISFTYIGILFVAVLLPIYLYMHKENKFKDL